MDAQKNNRVDSSKWDNHWAAQESSLEVRVSWARNRLKSKLNEYISPGVDVLDAGCGSGLLSKYLTEIGCNVYPLDYSEKAISVCRELTNNKCCKYLNNDFFDDNFINQYEGKFDIVLSDGLFEHYSDTDQSRILNNFVKMKKKSGYVVTFVPNKYALWQLVRPFVMPGIKEDPFIMRKLLKLHSNLEIIEKGGINVLPVSFSPEKFGEYIGMLLYVIAR